MDCRASDSEPVAAKLNKIMKANWEEVGFRGAACSRRKKSDLRVQQTWSGALNLDFLVLSLSLSVVEE